MAAIGPRSSATPRLRGHGASPGGQGFPGPEVSVILPVYNQFRHAAEVFDTVLGYARRSPGYHFVFVDDGSTDETFRILQERVRAAQDQRVSAISYVPNRGKGHAVKTGAAKCDGDIICFMDGDLAYTLDHLVTLVEGLRSHDVVIGSRHLSGRRQENISLRRRVLGWAFNRLARWILHLPYPDTQAGLKGFRRHVARRLFGAQRIHGFSFDAEMLFLARRYGYRIAQVPAQVSAGHSYNTGKIRLLRDSLIMLAELVRIRYHALRGSYA